MMLQKGKRRRFPWKAALSRCVLCGGQTGRFHESATGWLTSGASDERISVQGRFARSPFDDTPIFHNTPMASEMFPEGDAVGRLEFFFIAQRKNQIGFILIDPVGILE